MINFAQFRWGHQILINKIWWNFIQNFIENKTNNWFLVSRLAYAWAVTALLWVHLMHGADIMTYVDGNKIKWLYALYFNIKKSIMTKEKCMVHRIYSIDKYPWTRLLHPY